MVPELSFVSKRAFFCCYTQELIRNEGRISPENERVIVRLMKFQGISEFVKLYQQSQSQNTANLALDILSKYAPRFPGATLLKWVSTRTFGTDERWTVQYLVITTNAILKLFDDKTAKKSNVSFDLIKKAESNFVENSRMWNFNMQNEDEVIEIAFQSADDLHESLDLIKKFIGDQILQENNDNKGIQSSLECSFHDYIADIC